jgi:hypothetical protein
MTPHNLYNPLLFLDLFLYVLFLFIHREGGAGMVGYHVGGCRLRRSDRPLYSPAVLQPRRRSGWALQSW